MENTNNDVNTVVDATNNLGVGADQTAFTGTVQGASFQSNGGIRDILLSGSNSGAYDCDGVDDEIRVGSAPALTGMSELSFAFWMKAGSSNSDFASPFMKNDFSVNNGVRNYGTFFDGNGPSGKLNVAFSTANKNNIFLPTTTTSWLNTFHHVAFTYDGTTARLFVDGQQENSTSESGDILSQSSQLRFGRQDADNKHFYSGFIDDARFYNRSLSASEINQIYNSTEP
jgi:hypothetical protein